MKTVVGTYLIYGAQEIELSPNMEIVQIKSSRFGSLIVTETTAKKSDPLVMYDLLYLVSGDKVTKGMIFLSVTGGSEFLYMKIRKNKKEEKS